MIIKNLTRKGQQETVGFVIIIMIVMILGVIFMGISLRNKGKGVVTIDAEISNLIIASSSYTTDCYKDNEPNYRTLGDLSKDCYQRTFGQITCPGGRTSCDILNETYSGILKRFKPAGLIGYSRLEIYYLPRSEDNETLEDAPLAKKERIMELVQGNPSSCAVKRSGRSQISADEGSIFTELEICPSD